MFAQKQFWSELGARSTLLQCVSQSCNKIHTAIVCLLLLILTKSALAKHDSCWVPAQLIPKAVSAVCRLRFRVVRVTFLKFIGFRLILRTVSVVVLPQVCGGGWQGSCQPVLPLNIAHTQRFVVCCCPTTPAGFKGSIRCWPTTNQIGCEYRGPFKHRAVKERSINISIAMDILMETEHHNGINTPTPLDIDPSHYSAGQPEQSASNVSATTINPTVGKFTFGLCRNPAVLLKPPTSLLYP